LIQMLDLFDSEDPRERLVNHFKWVFASVLSFDNLQQGLSEDNSSSNLWQVFGTPSFHSQNDQSHLLQIYLWNGEFTSFPEASL
jgi:hypothetical protein